MTATEVPTTAQLRAQLTEQGVKARELRLTPADKRGDTYESDVAETRQTILSLDAELRASEAQDRELREWADAVERSKGPQAGMTDLEGPQRRTVGSMVEADEHYREWCESRGQYGSFPEIELNVRDVRALITESTSDTTAAGVWLPQGQPIAPVPRQRRLFVRDLLASGTTTLSSIPYIRELNPATNETGASATPEGSAKPEVTMSFVQVDAPVRKIAAWVPATMEILQDAPTLRSYIDNRLVYMVMLREENDLLTGVPTGSNPTVEGIYTVAGTQSVSTPEQSDSRDDALRTIAQAIGLVENVDGQADGIVMNPLDYWAAVSSRFGTGTTGQMDAPNPWNGPPGTMWGLPVVRTRALAQTDALVGDFRGGGQVFDNGGIVVRTSDSHDDYFVKNKIAILAEKRIAFAIFRPDFFVETEVGTPGE